MTRSARAVAVLVAVFVLLGVGAGDALALQQDATALGSQTLGRGYTHLFLAYALAWALVLGWVVSIARRLARVEHRLDEEG